MDKEILMFGDIKTEINKFYRYKSPATLEERRHLESISI